MESIVFAPHSCKLLALTVTYLKSTYSSYHLYNVQLLLLRPNNLTKYDWCWNKFSIYYVIIHFNNIVPAEICILKRCKL